MIRRAIIVASAALLVVACSPYYQANTAVDQTQKKIVEARSVQDKPEPAVVTKAGYYISTAPYVTTKTPSWMQRHVSLQAQQVPFSVLMERMLRQSNNTVTFDNTVQPDRLVSMNYTGTLKGALDALAAKTNYAYALNDREVRWSSFVDQTFNISFMPGQSTYLVGRSKDSEEAESTSGGMATSLGGTGKSMLDEKQYSNLQGELSVWRDLRRTLDELKSKEGHVVVSESTTSVTVHDHPDNVRAMSQYISRLNTSLSQEVSIKVQVIEVELNKEFNLGIDWDVLVKEVWKKNDLHLNGNLGSAADLVATNVIRNGGASAVSSLSVGTSILRALEKQGKVRVVTKPEVVTMNNQIAVIRITRNTGYVQSVSSTVTGVAGNITTSITPGSVTDGFTLYILPKIQNEKIYLQISSVLSNLLSLQNITVPASSSSSLFNAVEVPKISEKSFNQRSMVTSGSTLIVAGYKQLRDAVDNTKLFGVSALGGKGSESRNVETLVLITPTIIRNN